VIDMSDVRSATIEDRFRNFTRHKIGWGLLFWSILLSGCMATIPKELAQKVDKSVTFAELKKSPENYKGKLLLLGGKILEAKNIKEGTVFEILQSPLDYNDRPQAEDVSEGRFLALYKGYLDTAIYQPGRSITLAGEVLRAETRPLGEIEYTYPYLEVKSIFLWEGETYKESPTIIYYESFPYWWYYPYPLYRSK
jgi:outer membrane lipoprotein